MCCIGWKYTAVETINDAVFAAHWRKTNTHWLSGQSAGITVTIQYVFTSGKVSEANKGAKQCTVEGRWAKKTHLSILKATVTVSGEKQSPRTSPVENNSRQSVPFSRTEDDIAHSSAAVKWLHSKCPQSLSRKIQCNYWHCLDNVKWLLFSFPSRWTVGLSLNNCSARDIQEQLCSMALETNLLMWPSHKKITCLAQKQTDKNTQRQTPPPNNVSTVRCNRVQHVTLYQSH